MKLIEYLETKKFITIEDALTLFADKVLDSKAWEEYDTVENTIKLTKEMIKNRIINAVQNRGVPGKIIYVDSTMCDEDGFPIQVVSNSSYIRTSNIITWAVNNGYLTSSKTDETSADNEEAASDAGSQEGVDTSDDGNNVENQVGSTIPEQGCYDLIGYEDIISEETILKLKELSLPQMKQQVAILAAEKKKSDAAIIAAAKIGLLFYEKGLPRPANKNLFIEEYKKHFDILPQLPNTTIERIYKYLPDGYRRATEGGKIAVEQQDIDPIIKAATFAGAQAGDRDSMNLSRLRKSLIMEGYSVPSDDVLEKIIAAVKKLDLYEDE